MSVEQLCLLLVIPALPGWPAGLILRRRGFGLIANLIIGVAGSFLGRWLLGLIGFHASTTLALLITAVLGAVCLLWLLSFLPGRSGKRK